VRLRSFSASELVTAHVERIEKLDQRVKAFLRFTPELWEKQADEPTAESCVAISVRWSDPDGCQGLLCVRGVETTAGSQILRGFKPPYTGTAVSRLFDAGAVMLGVTNCDGSRWAAPPKNSGYHPRTTRGISIGCRRPAPVAAPRRCPRASNDRARHRYRRVDTTARALCGVVGMKPTYGRVSRYGLIAFASSLDQIGPFARSVEDAAIVLEAMAGRDPLDATSSDRPNDVLRDFDAA